MNGLLAATKKTLIDSVDSLSEGVDLLLSASTDSEVLDSIPLVSVGVKLLNARDSFRKHVYIRNCYAFVEACKGADRDRREKLWQCLAQDPARAEDFADTLFLIATESSKPIKATAVGRLVAALCNDQITYEQYDALVHVVHSSSIAGLMALQKFFDRCEGRPGSRAYEVEEEPLLLSCGLGYRYGDTFTVSKLGRTLFQIGFAGSVVQEELRSEGSDRWP